MIRLRCWAVLVLGVACKPAPAAEPPHPDPPPAAVSPGRLADAGPVEVEPEQEPEPGPSDAEFRAWDRKDPEGEKHLYRWDRDNFDTLRGYFHDVQCFARRAHSEGEMAFGAAPNTPAEQRWFQFKRKYVNALNGWQQQLFASNPRIMEKSKFLGMLLEAHEIATHGLLKAYNSADRAEVDKTDTHWAIVDAKVKKYSRNLGKTMGDAPAGHCTALKIP